MSNYGSGKGQGRNELKPNVESSYSSMAKKQALGEKKNVYLGWDKLVAKLEEKGYSKEYAEKIAGKINKEKYGK